MARGGTFRMGVNELIARKLAGRWTASVNGRTMTGFFGSEAQAFGAALLALTNRERDLEILSTGDTVNCGPQRHPSGS
jgi:hypothetical protein